MANKMKKFCFKEARNEMSSLASNSYVADGTIAIESSNSKNVALEISKSNLVAGLMPVEKQTHFSKMRNSNKMQTGTVAEGTKHKRYASQFLSLKFPLKMKYFVLVLGFAVLPNTSLMAQPTIVLGNANWSQHRNLNSFYISSNSCLDTLASWVNTRNWDTDGKTFALTTDITTFTGIIGASLFNPFKGTFDGRNPFIPNIVHTINLNIPSNPYSSTQQYVGLFGYIYEATIRNVIVTGTVQIYQYPQGLTGYVGGIAGYAKNSRIMNCISEVNVTSENNEVVNLIGGKCEKTILQ